MPAPQSDHVHPAGSTAHVRPTFQEASLANVFWTGQKFFNSDGAQYFIKGVAYQLTEHDPLLDNDQCKADAKLMKELGANTIRVYHVCDHQTR